MRAAVALILAAALAGACSDAGLEMDAAVLVDAGTEQVVADPGQLRVLRYHDDPTAGDDWTTVLAAEPTVVAATGSFREAASRTPEDDEPADARLLYEAVAPGRTLLVQLNCRGCDGASGVPETDIGSTGLHVWDFVVGDGGELALSTAARAGEEHDAQLGEHVVVVRRPGQPDTLAELDGDVLVHVARHRPDDGADLLVDVFAAVGEGPATVTYGGGGSGDEYPVLVVGERSPG